MMFVVVANIVCVCWFGAMLCWVRRLRYEWMFVIDVGVSVSAILMM